MDEEERKKCIERAEDCIDREWFSNAADWYEKAGEHEKAKGILTKVIEGDIALNDYASAGDHYEQLGNIDKARECWRIGAQALVDQNLPVKASGYYEKLGDTEKAKECLEKGANSWIEAGRYDKAAECYNEAKEPEKEKECLIRHVDTLISERNYRTAAQVVGRIGDAEKQKEYFMILGRLEAEHGSYWYAGNNFELAGCMDLAARCYTVAAAQWGSMGHQDVADNLRKAAAECFGKLFSAYDSLSELPQKLRDEMLGLVKDGDITATQGLAALVKTEEDELIFNEARARMVL
jgi:uncharacterized protein HemY